MRFVITYDYDRMDNINPLPIGQFNSAHQDDNWLVIVDERFQFVNRTLAIFHAQMPAAQSKDAVGRCTKGADFEQARQVGIDHGMPYVV